MPYKNNFSERCDISIPGIMLTIGDMLSEPWIMSHEHIGKPIVVMGHEGSGKTQTALALALNTAKSTEQDVSIVYFGSRLSRQTLKNRAVDISLDVPRLSINVKEVVFGRRVNFAVFDDKDNVIEKLNGLTGMQIIIIDDVDIDDTDNPNSYTRMLQLTTALSKTPNVRVIVSANSPSVCTNHRASVRLRALGAGVILHTYRSPDKYIFDLFDGEPLYTPRMLINEVKAKEYLTQSMPETERKLRQLLCIRVGGGLVYMDDGEMSCCAQTPHIDFLRDTPWEIEKKIMERN